VLGDGSIGSLGYSLVEKGFRRAVALDETVVEMYGFRAYVWSAVDVDSPLIKSLNIDTSTTTYARR